MPGGRPPLYTDPQEVEAKINAYFDYCDNFTVKEETIDFKTKTKKIIELSKPKPYTIVGLARWLGMDRVTLLEYALKEEFSSTIKDAKVRVEEQLEENLRGGNVTGTIFNLKNNFGWKDKTEVEHSGNMTIGKALDELENGSKTL